MVLTTPELIVWWWVFFVGVLPGIWHAIRNRFNEIQPLLFFLLGLGVLYSLMFGNVGLAYRQRAQLLPWLLIFAMVGLEQRNLRRIAKRKPATAAQPGPQRAAIIDQSSPPLIAMSQVVRPFPERGRPQVPDAIP